jgi:anti-sigma factor RsiW
MNCEQCIEQLGDAVDEALSSDEREQIEAHCLECEACRDLLADLKEIRAALQAEPESLVAQSSLLEALRMKVSLLQEKVSLMNARPERS